MEKCIIEPSKDEQCQLLLRYSSLNCNNATVLQNAVKLGQLSVTQCYNAWYRMDCYNMHCCTMLQCYRMQCRLHWAELHGDNSRPRDLYWPLAHQLLLHIFLSSSFKLLQILLLAKQYTYLNTYTYILSPPAFPAHVFIINPHTSPNLC